MTSREVLVKEVKQNYHAKTSSFTEETIFSNDLECRIKFFLIVMSWNLSHNGWCTKVYMVYFSLLMTLGDSVHTISDQRI